MNEQLKNGIRNTQETLAALPEFLLEERGETVSSDEQNTLNNTCAYLDDAIAYFTSLDDLKRKWWRRWWRRKRDEDKRKKREQKGFEILGLINTQINLRKKEKGEAWERRLSGIRGARLHAYPFRRIKLGLQDDIL